MSRARGQFVGSLLVTFVFACGEAPTTPRLPGISAAITAQGYDCTIQSDLDAQTECPALVALFESTEGTGWFNNTGWLQTTHPCSWYGVTCGPAYDPAFTVLASLDLVSNNLRGPIPFTFWLVLGLNSGLLTIDFSGNSISGDLIALDDFPGAGFHGSSFRSIKLSGNQLTGPVPFAFWTIIDLFTLHQSDNDFVGVLPSVYGEVGYGEDPQIDCDLSGNPRLTVPSFYDRNLDGLFCGVAVTGIEPVAASTVDLIGYYVSTKLLRRPDGNTLTNLVRAALRERAKGRYAKAIGNIQSYLDQVTAWVPGKLTTGQSGALRTAGDALLHFLQDEAGA
jgi:hypothetical protein